MHKRWAVGLILISILTMACGGAASVDEYKAAFVYVGPTDDGGWSQAHDVGRQYLVEQTGIQTEYTALVPEDATEFRTVAEAYIEQGYNIIFGTTFGYIDAMAEMAEEYPDVIFLHCSGYLNNDTNFANYFGKMYQPRYLSGLAAGAMTDSNKIGYVAAFPIPEVIRGINAFAAGVNEVNPEATVEVVWTFTWFGSIKSVREEERVFTEKFAPFIHQNNAVEIIEELELAYQHITRNGSAKIIFMDLTLKMVVLLHAKSINLQTTTN